MIISMVAAMGEGYTLGNKNRLPWPRMAADMKRFHDSITDKTVIMGRTSYDSLPRELSWRTMIVLSQDMYVPKYKRTQVAGSVEEALALAQKDMRSEDEEVMIAGGASIFELFLPRADRMYLTYIHGKFEADRFFPKWNEQEWQETQRQDFEADEKNPYPYTFATLKHRKEI